MERSEIEKKFPSAFPVDKLPKEAKEECIEVYRVCETGKVEAASFQPTYLDVLAQTKENIDDEDIGHFSMSVYEKWKDIKKRHKFFKKRRSPAAIIAKGVTDRSCGPVQRSSERTGQTDSHIDWWLYTDAQPHIFFEQVNLTEVTGVKPT